MASHLYRGIKWCADAIAGAFGLSADPLFHVKETLQERVQATREMSCAEILARARSESRQKFYCPHCGQMMLENGCESCEHRTDGRDCLCDGCNGWGRANPVGDVLAAKRRIDNDLGYTFDGIPLRGPVKASVTTAIGGVRSTEVTIHRLPDRTQLVFATPMTIEPGETLCLTFAPVTMPTSR